MSIQPRTIQISNKAARNFLLSHQFLLPSKQLGADQIIDTLFARLGCIQFDSINVVGRNADLVLQSRIKNYTPDILNSLLYKTRDLIDGWDKVASIFPATDWPYFSQHRARMGEYHQSRSQEAMEAAPSILEAIKNGGPKSSLDFKNSAKTDWFWGPTSLAKACLEILFAQGHLGVDHRVNTRRYFDRIERLLPKSILETPDPFNNQEDYVRWHLLRRIGSLGIASMQSGEHWGGIQGARKVKPRQDVFNQLISYQEIIPISIENTSGREYYIRGAELDILDQAVHFETETPSVAFIAPLDNLIWNRNLIEDIFQFSYTWEVYKPKSKRKYGYYVLPVLYKNKFIARADMKFDRKLKRLILINWWWEDPINPDEEIKAAVIAGFKDFLSFNSGDSLEIKSSNLATSTDRRFFKNVLQELV